jgi:N-dimethylarginine dimethylaminohydrolase
MSKLVALMREPTRGGFKNYAKALRQHRKLQKIYRRHGYKVELLPRTRKYVAAHYTQDTALITGGQALILNCLSWWRTKEARHGKPSVEAALSRYFPVQRLGLPALLDGGEIVHTDDEILVGVQSEAARQAVRQIRKKLHLDKPLRTVSLREKKDIIHLGTEMSYIGDDRLLITERMGNLAPVGRYDTWAVPPGDENAANCVRLEDGTLIVPKECKETIDWMLDCGYEVEPVDLSEFNAPDIQNGSISCLSINFRAQ